MEYANLTAHGVCYDIEHSPFFLARGGYIFHFSSAAHMDKFNNGYAKKIDWLNDSLSRRFKIEVQANDLALLQWYMQVETRGFFIKDYEGGEYKCPKDVKVVALGSRRNYSGSELV